MDLEEEIAFEGESKWSQSITLLINHIDSSLPVGGSPAAIDGEK